MLLVLGRNRMTCMQITLPPTTAPFVCVGVFHNMRCKDPVRVFTSHTYRIICIVVVYGYLLTDSRSWNSVCCPARKTVESIRRDRDRGIRHTTTTLSPYLYSYYYIVDNAIQQCGAWFFKTWLMPIIIIRSNSISWSKVSSQHVLTVWTGAIVSCGPGTGDQDWYTSRMEKIKR